ncbi:MAG: hypothetical protein WD205_06045, partial [Rhodothermales bacterium]
MKAHATDFVTALTIPAIAALGGALAVYSGYEYAPGGVLIGIVLIMGAVALGLRAAQRRRSCPRRRASLEAVMPEFADPGRLSSTSSPRSPCHCQLT